MNKKVVVKSYFSKEAMYFIGIAGSIRLKPTIARLDQLPKAWSQYEAHQMKRKSKFLGHLDQDELRSLPPGHVKPFIDLLCALTYDESKSVKVSVPLMTIFILVIRKQVI